MFVYRRHLQKTYYIAGVISVSRDYGSEAVIRNCLFLRCGIYQDCHSGKFRTGVIACNGKTKIESCSIIDCSFIGDAFRRTDGQEWIDRCGPIVNGKSVVNTLIVGCRNENGALQPCAVESAKYTYCANDAVLLSGEGNVQISKDAIHFQNASEDRFIPVDGPTVDAGASLSWMPDSADVRGRPRINGSKPDIGAYEYHEPNTYYLTAEGDDGNDGLTPATAKATISAAHALLSDEDEKISVGDGSFALPEETIVLSNGWSIVGGNGPAATAFYATSVDKPLFAMETPGTLIKGLTVDFKKLSFTDYNTCSFLRNPKGTVEDCIIENYNYKGYDQNGHPAIVKIGNSDAPVFSNVVFRNSFSNYRASFIDVLGSSAPVFHNCTFSDLTVGGYFSYGTVYVDKKSANPTFRNCLFLRCRNNQDVHKYKFRTAVVHFNDGENTSAIDNCSFIDCSFFGSGFRTNDTTWADGCGVVIKGGKVRNCLFLNCTNELGATQFSVMNETTVARKPDFSHCAAEIALEGEGNVRVSAADIRYRSKRRADYTIAAGPTIDAGESLPWHSGATDLYGRSRVIGNAVDIGCGEFDPSEIPGLKVIFR